MVSARVTGVSTGVSKGLGINRPRKYRIVSYAYEYKGASYESTRQGLIAARAYGPDVVVGDSVQVRVCRSFRSLTCPNRVLFEAKVLAFCSAILIASGFAIYALPA